MAGIKITITEGTNEVDSLKLNIAELEMNTEYTKLALCIKVDAGMTQEDKPFFKFTMLDKGGRKIVGRIFNVESVESKGIVANKIANTVVKIRFMLTKFSGTESLTLYSIDPVKDDIISSDEFIGKLEGVQESMAYLRQVVDRISDRYPRVAQLVNKYELLRGAELVVIPELWAGRKGGAVKFSNRLMHMCEGCILGDADVNRALTVVLLSEIFMYWKYSCNYEDNILSLGENINKVLAKSDRYLDAVIDSAEKGNATDELNVCKEIKHMIKCYFNYDTPKTYITQTIWYLRESLTKSILLSEANDGMLSGTYKSVDVGDGVFEMIKL